MKAILLAAALVSACGGGGAAGAADELTGWTRSANFTSCAQWEGEMTQGQREVMARDLLPILRSTVDTAATGGEELASAFVDAITLACNSEAVRAFEDTSGEPYVITAAATVAFLETDRFQP